MLPSPMHHHWQATFELEDSAQWSMAEATLRRRCGDTAADVQLVRLGPCRGLVMLGVEGEGVVADVRASIVDPWLAELSLVGAPDVRAGAFVDLCAEQNPEERLAAFVERVLRAETIWGLYGHTWAREDAGDDAEVLPFWSNAALAARCVRGKWDAFAPRAIELDAFIDQWLPGMEEDGILAAISPSPRRPGDRVSPRVVLALLSARGDFQASKPVPEGCG